MSTDTENLSKRERQKVRRQERLEKEAAQNRRAGARRTAFTIIAAVVGIALVGGLGYLLVQGTDATLGVAAATAESDDAALPAPTGQGTEDVAVGETPPVISGQTPAGEPVTIGGEGQAQAVAFLAHWCSHCQNEAPLVADWVDQGLLPEDVELVGVSTLHDPAAPNWPPDDWLDDVEWPGPVLVDHDETAAEAWGLEGTPMWVFLDDTGTVVARYSGEIGAETFAEGAALAAGDAAEATSEG